MINTHGKAGVLAMLLMMGAYGEPLPATIQQIMAKPRYARATWSLLVTDIDTGISHYELNADKLSFTGSTRKLFSVGLALKTLGPERRQRTEVLRSGPVDGAGVLRGNLVLRAGGDLTLGGRRLADGAVEFTNFDHNDANGLGSANLTPQDPLYGLDQLADQVWECGIRSIEGSVVVDDGLFKAYRVPNGNLLISPMMVNENQVDVTLTPTAPGQMARLDYRPKTGFFGVVNRVMTGGPESVVFSDDRLASGGQGTVSGNLPMDYRAPMTKLNAYVGTFRVEDPKTFAQVAFGEALERRGIEVSSSSTTSGDLTPVAEFLSPPYFEHARLVLKVSLNLGANLSLSLFGLEKGETTIAGALAAERKALIEDFGLRGDQFDFPTNGSGTPDSQASPRALVTLLCQLAKSPVGADFEAALPIMGVDGSLATSGKTLPGRGHVFAKPGTTVSPGPDGQTLQLKAQNLAGYIHTKSGRRVAYALMVNDAGAVNNIEADVGQVFEDEATISSLIYETL